MQSGVNQEDEVLQIDLIAIGKLNVFLLKSNQGKKMLLLEFDVGS